MTSLATFAKIVPKKNLSLFIWCQTTLPCLLRPSLRQRNVVNNQDKLDQVHKWRHDSVICWPRQGEGGPCLFRGYHTMYLLHLWPHIFKPILSCPSYKTTMFVHLMCETLKGFIFRNQDALFFVNRWQRTKRNRAAKDPHCTRQRGWTIEAKSKLNSLLSPNCTSKAMHPPSPLKRLDGKWRTSNQLRNTSAYFLGESSYLIEIEWFCKPRRNLLLFYSFPCFSLSLKGNVI